METKKIIEITKEDKYGKNHKRNKILVNLITSIRSLGTVAIVPIFVNAGSFVTALAACGFFLTDCIDGFLARKLHVESFFGSLLDALSDKAFGIVCLLLLSTLNPIFLAVIGVELGIFAINYTSAQKDNNVKSSKVGKAKTLLLAASIVGSFFCYGAPTIKELLNYVNISSFNKLLEMNPDILSSILAIPTIGASLYAAKDYLSIAKTQEKTQTEPSAEKRLAELDESIAEIAKERQQLLDEKEEILERKTKQEIIHDLFDTDFYHENKDARIKSLLYKKRQWTLWQKKSCEF